ncbi:MoaD/ThiS family protein [Pedobacter endophyticus]|uniref:MoaD/ThiS family protein n=1 Tax=Pedobacter endophyticus TaxID=2789740 RepID=A0A7S9L0I6_9SPHI|nr:MoaD/ThiS family protein [Pedobacter endophyticus]QPH40260.1 MoaD/ThiS family protein [Pedobacter endophyticus]
MATVLIPTPLRKYTNNTAKVNASGHTVAEIMNDLVSTYPDMKKYLFDGAGTIRSFVNIFVDQEDVRSLNRTETEVETNSIVSIVPAIAGGIYKK